jgi:hypothetical protein
VNTALEVARALGPRLWGVRLDTSESLVDRSLWNELGDFKPTGVNERLVRCVRDALDRDGFERVKIVASGGFDVEKIDINGVAFRNAKLSASSLDDCVSHSFSGEKKLPIIPQMTRIGKQKAQQRDRAALYAAALSGVPRSSAYSAS